MAHQLSTKGQANRANQRQSNRNKAKFAAWRAFHRFEKLHIKRIEAHLGRHPRDLQAVGDLERFKGMIRRIR